MDYATLTDNQGRKADFRNVILIMTTNAGARDIGKPLIGFGERIVTESAVNDAVERAFTPEFRNRLDKIVTFNRLDERIVLEIVDKEIRAFQKQLAEKTVTLEVTEAARKWVARRGLFPRFRSPEYRTPHSGSDQELLRGFRALRRTSREEATRSRTLRRARSIDPCQGEEWIISSPTSMRMFHSLFRP